MTPSDHQRAIKELKSEVVYRAARLRRCERLGWQPLVAESSACLAAAILNVQKASQLAVSQGVKRKTVAAWLCGEPHLERVVHWL